MQNPRSEGVLAVTSVTLVIVRVDPADLVG